MPPPKSCPNCEHFQKKEHLTKNNQVITKEYCRRFHQELFSHQACPKFRYHEDLETDVGTIYGTIGAVSAMAAVACVIVFIIGLEIKSDLTWCISLITGVLSGISAVIFIHIDNKIEKKALYGDSAEDSGIDDESD